MEINPYQKLIAINDRSSIGEARRFSMLLADRARIRQAERGRVPLIVTELATNLLLHANGGEILLGMLPVAAGPGLEIVALDRGPGIADLQRCMTDGYSSRGTRGCGLGAVRRLSSEFDIYSAQPAGTVVISRVLDRPKSAAEPEFSTITVPLAGEIECGDAWHFRWKDLRLAMVVVDGLGHGPLAASAASQAVEVFDQRPFDPPVNCLEAAHHALRSSRGVALAIAQVELASHQLYYAGIGNIAGRIINAQDGRSRSLLSHNGIVGLHGHKPQQFNYQWHDGDLLVMHSDGISERWKMSDYPGLTRAAAGVIAAILYRDGKRGRDDATVLVVRLKAN